MHFLVGGGGVGGGSKQFLNLPPLRAHATVKTFLKNKFFKFNSKIANPGSVPVGIIADDEQFPGLLPKLDLSLDMLLDEVVLEVLLLDGLGQDDPRDLEDVLPLHQLLPGTRQHLTVSLYTRYK